VAKVPAATAIALAVLVIVGIASAPALLKLDLPTAGPIAMCPRGAAAPRGPTALFRDQVARYLSNKWRHDMYGWGSASLGIVGWIAMAVVMVLFWGGAVAVVVVLLRRSRSDYGLPGFRPSHHEAERILHERFARGEIDETEYLARRAALRRPE